MTKTMMPLLKRPGRSDGRSGEASGRRRKMKPIKLPETLRVKAPRARTNQISRVTVLNTTRIRIENNPTAKVSKLASRKKLHGKARNMSNRRNIKRGVAKSSSTRNRKRSTISSKNMNW